MLKSVEEARRTILAGVSTLPAEQVTLWEARDRVLAAPVCAEQNVPPFRNSAMDGYAVRAADVEAATPTHPVLLKVVAEVAAGQPASHAVRKGEAVRIMTGAPVPDGADAVVRFEESSEQWSEARRPDSSVVAICGAVCPTDNVREAGEDVREGEVVLEPGALLRSAQIGVLASLGVERVSVVRRPRVAVLATGDELLPPGAPMEPGKIRNSNEYTVSCLVEEAGGIPVPLGIARDSVESLSSKLAEGLSAGVDLFLTSAGVSVGDYDLVKEVLATHGKVSFWQVAIKPGKPLAFGRLRDKSGEVPLLGLPGNPVAAMVAFHVFARPLIRLLAGRQPLLPPVVQARLLEDVENSGRRHYMRALVRRGQQGELEVTTRGSGVRVQGSGILSSMVWANCFVVVPDGTTGIPEGSMVNIELFQWMEEV